MNVSRAETVDWKTVGAHAIHGGSPAGFLISSYYLDPSFCIFQVYSPSLSRLWDTRYTTIISQLCSTRQCLSSACWESNLNDKHRQNKKKTHTTCQPTIKEICVCIYICICTSLSLSPSLSILIYIYVLPNIPQPHLTKQFLPSASPPYPLLLLLVLLSHFIRVQLCVTP